MLDTVATFQNLAKRQMEKWGSNATLERVTRVYDEELDTTTTTTASSTILFVLADVEIQNKDGVKSTESVLRSNSELRIKDRVVAAGKTYVIESVKPTLIKGAPIFWEAKVCA